MDRIFETFVNYYLLSQPLKNWELLFQGNCLLILQYTTPSALADQKIIGAPPEADLRYAGSIRIFADHVVLNQPLCGYRHTQSKSNRIPVSAYELIFDFIDSRCVQLVWFRHMNT